MGLRVRKTKRTHLAVDLDALANKFDLGVRVLSEGRETLLDTLDLLCDSRQDTLLETVELIETAPGSDLTQTNENTTHGLEVESLVTAENEDESTELHAKCLDGLGFT